MENEDNRRKVREQKKIYREVKKEIKQEIQQAHADCK